MSLLCLLKHGSPMSFSRWFSPTCGKCMHFVHIIFASPCWIYCECEHTAQWRSESFINQFNDSFVRAMCYSFFFSFELKQKKNKTACDTLFVDSQMKLRILFFLLLLWFDQAMLATPIKWLQTTAKNTATSVNLWISLYVKHEIITNFQVEIRM